MTGSRIAWIVGLALALPSGAARAQEKPARLDYRVACVVDGVQDRLEIELAVAGLDPEQRDVAFELPIWGGWLSIDEYYVTRVQGSPPVHHDLVNRMYWRPELPADWDGKLAIRYAIPIVELRSAARTSIALTPWRTATYVHGYSVNTLMRLLVGDTRQDGDRHVVFTPPPGWSVATGFGGVTLGAQEIALAPEADNTSLLFGIPVAVAFRDAAGVAQGGGDFGHVEVAQFGGTDDRSELVVELAARVRAGYATTTGVAAPTDEHLFITEPGLGGTHTDGSISMGHPAADDAGRFDVSTAAFIAHECFHAWLPGVLKAGEPGDEWFFEGFTDYFALWQLAHEGAITPQQFIDQLRMYDLIARGSPAFGKVAFADRDVNWRDADAEHVAYQGGALFAFFMDEALRRAGRPGLPQLFRDLMRENGGRYTRDALEQWCAKSGLAELWEQSAVAPALPDVIAALTRLGCVETREGEARVVKVPPLVLDPFFRFAPEGVDGLVETGGIALPGVSGRIDHLAYDAERGRLFVCALGNGTVEVVDVAAGKQVESLGKFEEPQGVAVLAEAKQVAVACGGDGKLRVFDAATLKEVKTLDAGDDADNVRFDAKADRLWIGAGEGLVSFDVATWRPAARVKLAGHAESFQLEKEGVRAFVNVPSARHVAVVDRAKGEVVATWPLDGASSNYPMALDEKNARLYVGCRSPAEVVVLDTKSGKVASKCPIGGDCDDLFLDPERARLYATCGDGCVSVLALEKDGALKPAGRFTTADGARTSLFVPSLAKLFVAAPKRGGHEAEVRVVDVSGKK